MLANYVKIAFRTLLRNRSYAIINILGLTIGIAACLLIFVLVQFELSFDNFHPKRDRIYRLVSVSKNPGGTHYTAGVPFPVPDALRRECPLVENVTAIFGTEDNLITIPEKDGKTSDRKFQEQSGVFFADPQFLQIFDFPLLAGDPRTVLSEPNTAVITRTVAERYFGDWKQSLGKIVKYRNRDLVKIVGVLQDIPANSDFPLKLVISYKSFEIRNPTNFKDWVSVFGQHYCFALLPQNSPPSDLDTFLGKMVRDHKPPEYVKDEIHVQPLGDMHFDSRFGTFSDRTFSRELIMAVTLIGLFLLLIACVNFINLATAQAVGRSREVGVRKVLGGIRKQLAIQFLSETALIVIIAVFVASAFSELALPFLNQLLQVSLSLNPLRNPEIFGFLSILGIVVTFLSGLYPALIMSGFSPVVALKSGAVDRTGTGLILRRGLVVLQFVIAQVLIVVMIVVVRQMDFFRSASLGFDKDAIVTVPIPKDSLSLRKIDVLKNRLQVIPGITSVSFSTFTASDVSHWGSDFKFDRSSRTTDFDADLLWADADFFKTYNLQFVCGKPYMQSDSVRGFVVNQTLVAKLGIRDPNDALGKQLDFWNGTLVAPIVGVVKDFHERPLRRPIYPAVLGSYRDTYQLINIKIQPQEARSGLVSVERLWKETYPDYVYEYKFLDEKIDSFYKEEEQFSRLASIFAGIAIFISCLGLYGLVSFMTQRRTKEVGIRKVLGASSGAIVYLFSKEFTILIGIAFLIAAPIAYLVMEEWLNNFAYKAPMSPGIYLITISGAQIFAWLAVGYRTIRAAVANPVKALRYE